MSTPTSEQRAERAEAERDEARGDAASKARWIERAKQREDRLLDALDEAERERDSLARWKAEALTVIGGLQVLGKALDLPRGVQVTGPQAVEAVKALRAERDEARADAEDESRARIALGNENLRLLATLARVRDNIAAARVYLQEDSDD